MAERQGFEPWRPLSRPTHFPGAPVQPLRHLSTELYKNFQTHPLFPKGTCRPGYATSPNQNLYHPLYGSLRVPNKACRVYVLSGKRSRSTCPPKDFLFPRRYLPDQSPRYGLRAFGKSMLPSSVWKFSRRQRTVRARATPEPFSV